MSVGRRIKDRRNELQISVDELSRKLNKNRATIYRYEKGEIENLPLDILESLAEALDTTPQYLMGWDTKELVTTRISDGDEESVYTSVNKSYVNHVEMWHKEFGMDPFTEEEHKKLMEYGRFLLSLRGK